MVRALKNIGCDRCGRVEHIDLVDAKPDEPGNPDGCDWNRLECIACYGPGWLPATEDAIPLSINDELHGLYLGFRLKRWIGARSRWIRGLIASRAHG